MADGVDWVSPFDRIVAVHDVRQRLVQVYEEHSRGRCRGAAAWSAHHYRRAGGVVLDSWRDGPRDVFLLREGEGELRLEPSRSPAGIESAFVEGGSILVTYAGIGGGGVGVARCRGPARGVLDVEVQSQGGGGGLGRARLRLPRMLKLHVGIDDTDSEGEGATWSLANELGCAMEGEGLCEYLDHTLVQLHRMAPGRTANCVATVLTFAVPPDGAGALVERASDLLAESTFSDHTGMAAVEGIQVPERLVAFSDTARERIVTLEEARAVARETGARLVEVTGERGLIGALAAIGYAERHEEAVALGGDG